jgi:hypothetical protein
VSRTRFGKASIFTAAAIVTSVFFINFCDFVYQCGCESLWSGAADHCNVHDPGARHCPWCSIGTAGSIGVWAIMVAAQAAVVFLWRGLPWAPRALFALLAFPVTGAVLALVVGLAKGYWR